MRDVLGVVRLTAPVRRQVATWQGGEVAKSEASMRPAPDRIGSDRAEQEAAFQRQLKQLRAREGGGEVHGEKVHGEKVDGEKVDVEPADEAAPAAADDVEEHQQAGSAMQRACVSSEQVDLFW